MIIKNAKISDIQSSEITPQSVFEDRRRLLRGLGFAGLAATMPVWGGIFGAGHAHAFRPAAGKELAGKPTKWTSDLIGAESTAYDVVTRYNNFYEFGTGKDEPHRNAHTLVTDPWTIQVDGAVERPGTYDINDLIKPDDIEDRVYRFRCVEAWSMVIPWLGVPLNKVISRLGPTSTAKYVYFETLNDPKQMPGVNRPVLEWPYKEGLRMDEAMNDLTLLAVGLYGEVMPNQNGAPIRLVVPWKYGFKSIKSIVRISFQEKEPPTSWSLSNPKEYGFYSNVNPTVSHPRWSQKFEKKIGTSAFFGLPKRVPTEMFNGYGEQVASLYDGMDLRVFK